MACKSKIKATFDKHGKIVGELNSKGIMEYKYAWVCEGDCPDKKTRCRVIQGKPDHHGGVREWCGCPGDPPKEPQDCHLVVYKPGKGTGGGPPEIFCAGNGCNKGYHCPEEPIETVIADVPGGGKVVWLTCSCVPDAP
jgi:hypothetical protein